MVFQPGVFQPGVFQGAGGGIFGSLNAQETGSDTAQIEGATIPKAWGALAAQETGGDTAAVAARVIVGGVLIAQETGKDSAAVLARVAIFAALVTQETGADTAAIAANVEPKVWVTIAAQETGSDTAAFAGTSDGTIIIIPRDVSGGIAYLVEVQAYDTTANAIVVLCYSSVDFNSLPTDPLPNQHYANRLDVPGNYERNLFSYGTTSGALSVGAGVIEIKNLDGALDALKNFAFDGYAVRVLTIPRLRPRYEDAIVVFEGTMEQAELTWNRFNITIRDRLAELDRPIQTHLYAGTTIAGGMNEAEGLAADLKGKPKPLAFGRPLSVPAVASNSFDRMYDLADNGLFGIGELRDKGVKFLDSVGDYATIAALRTASIAAGRFGTQLVGGRFRPQTAPGGQLTAAPIEGATAAARTAAQIARRMLLRMGFVEGSDYIAADIVALDALNSAEIGYWIGAEEMTGLQAIGDVLGSIGASIVPDRLGIMRMRRFGAPSTPPVATYELAEILGSSGRGIERLATGDSGKGVQSWKINVQYAKNYAVTDANGLAGSVQINDQAYVAFAAEEWRTAVAQNPAIKLAHRLAPELTFQTYFVNEADALAEANRLLALHSVPRDRFKVPFKSYLTEGLDLASVVRLQFPRFGLKDGKDFVVIGMEEDYGRGVTTLDLWG